MFLKVRHLIQVALAATLTIGSCLVVTTHTASAAPAASCADCITLTASAEDWRGYSTYEPGGARQVRFQVTNPSDALMRDVIVTIPLPEGTFTYNDWWEFDTGGGVVNYDVSSRTITAQPISPWLDSNEIGVMSPGDVWEFSAWIYTENDLAAPTLTFSSSVAWAERSGEAQTPVSNELVLPLAPSYVLQSETSFSPSTVSGGGTSVMKSKITNNGNGGAENLYFYMHIDDRLTVDLSTVPTGCDYIPAESWVSWDGEPILIPQKLSCEYAPLLGPGESVEFTVTVTAPSVAGPEEYEGSTVLSCTSGADGAFDGTKDGDTSALLLLNPPASGELRVLQLGGPVPVAMPSAGSEPQQPTAGEAHSVTTYVFNVGGTDIASAVTVAVTIPAGFTPTKISAITNDSGASAPVCTLATRTCVFSSLASEKSGRIVIEGTLSSTLPNKSKLTVSASASAASLSTATDSAAFAVTSLSTIRLSVVATSAYVSGSPVTFTLSASNQGPSSAKQPTVKVTLPDGGAFVSVPTGCSASGRTMTCSWTSIPSNGVRSKEFTAKFGNASRASASAVLTTSTPLTKDSVTRDSASRAVADWRLTRAIASAVVESNLPATGSNSNGIALAALLLVMSGSLMTAIARRRRILD